MLQKSNMDVTRASVTLTRSLLSRKGWGWRTRQNCYQALLATTETCTSRSRQWIKKYLQTTCMCLARNKWHISEQNWGLPSHRFPTSTTYFRTCSRTTIRNSNNKCSRNKIQSQTHDVYIGLKKKVKGILANAEGGKQVFNVLTVNSSSSSSPDSPNISAMRFLQKKLYLLISFPQGNYAVSITKNSSHWKSWHVCSWNSNTTASYSSTAFHLVTLLFVAIYTAELPLIVSDYKFVPLKMP